MSVRINPSILSADFANFEREVARIDNADFVHVDVMDNHFVPNLTFGLPMVERLQQVSPVPLDVHLMIDDPDRWAPGFADAGAAVVTFHYEACHDVVSTARDIRSRGARAGVALKPATGIDEIVHHLDEFDQVLVMTVEPGFGGQEFMADMMPKVERLRAASVAAECDVWLQVDGGIAHDTIGVAARAGADTFVAGSSVFGTEREPAAEVTSLRRRAEASVS